MIEISSRVNKSIKRENDDPAINILKPLCLNSYISLSIIC